MVSSPTASVPIASAVLLMLCCVASPAFVVAQITEGECDPLVPEYCMLPYPNDFWRIETDNGPRLNFSINTLPIGTDVTPLINYCDPGFYFMFLLIIILWVLCIILYWKYVISHELIN